ncbi:MAG: DUF4013 domain-containing protein [Thermoanaerobaculaceae bacterium]|jgi:hypothetical protein|nr:DUF4013 domain-containing protein [Thermoanaerobaculaceae bacterium]
MTGSFTFMFRDPRWLHRVIVGALLELAPALLAAPALYLLVRAPSARTAPLLLLPLLLGLASRFVVLGYLRRLVRGVLDGTLEGLPAWDSTVEDLEEGFALWLAAVGLWLPAAAATFTVWLVAAELGGPAIAWLTALLVAAPAALLTLALTPAALVAAIARDDLAAAFDLPLVTHRLRAAGGTYVLAFVVGITAEVLAQLGLLLCCIGVAATRFLAHCVAVHAFATAFRGGAPPSIPSATGS